MATGLLLIPLFLALLCCVSWNLASAQVISAPQLENKVEALKNTTSTKMDELNCAFREKMDKYFEILERKECVLFNQKRSVLQLTHLETGIYYFHHPQAFSWFEAKYICEVYGMHLATFESKEEVNHVWESQPDRKAWRTNSLWVSGSNIKSKSAGEYTWLEGHQVEPSWLKNEKSALSDQKEKRNMCLYLTKGELHNTTCSFNNLFICKVPIELLNCLDTLRQKRKTLIDGITNLINPTCTSPPCMKKS